MIKKSLTPVLSSNSFYGDYFENKKYVKLVTSSFPASQIRSEIFILQWFITGTIFMLYWLKELFELFGKCNWFLGNTFQYVIIIPLLTSANPKTLKKKGEN